MDNDPAAAAASAESPPRCSEAMQKAIADMSSGATNIQLLCKRITDEDVAVLAEALKQNRTVSKLGLYGNRITDVGAFMLADALQTNRTLRSCDVKGNDAITPRGFDAVESAMKSRAMNDEKVDGGRIRAVASLCVYGETWLSFDVPLNL